MLNYVQADLPQPHIHGNKLDSCPWEHSLFTLHI